MLWGLLPHRCLYRLRDLYIPDTLPDPAMLTLWLLLSTWFWSYRNTLEFYDKLRSWVSAQDPIGLPMFLMCFYMVENIFEVSPMKQITAHLLHWCTYYCLSSRIYRGTLWLILSNVTYTLLLAVSRGNDPLLYAWQAYVRPWTLWDQKIV
jgi:hypothetical protein